MKTVVWLGRVLLVPTVGCLLLAWWVAAALARDGYGMSSWAALLLFGGLALAAAVPRVAIGALFGAFALQLVRAECRFDQVGWLAYAAVPLVAIVLAALTGEDARRRTLLALLPLGVLVGVFTNLPFLGDQQYGLATGPQWGVIQGTGIVNGKSWGYSTVEVLVDVAVWSAGALLLIVAGWSIGSTYRSRRLQWAAEDRADAARAALAVGDVLRRTAEERDRIAQDVHDITAHSLSVILAQADGGAAEAADERTRVVLGTIAASARSSLVEIRTLLEHLEDPASGDALRSAAALPELVEGLRRSGADVRFEQHGEAVPLGAAGDLACYRIVQEALTNALRHGAPGRPVRVSLDWQTDGLAIVVASALPAPPGEPGEDGRGLIGMRQRALLVGGWLTAGGDGEEYVVAAHLPSRPTVAP